MNSYSKALTGADQDVDVAARTARRPQQTGNGVISICHTPRYHRGPTRYSTLKKAAC